jgi:hypothetical protein
MEGWRQRRPGSEKDHSTSKGNYKTDLTITGLLMEGPGELTSQGCMLERDHEKRKVPIYKNFCRDYAPARKFPAKGGIVMPDPRKVIDCRNFPSEKNCTITISGTEEKVLDLADLHASTVHGHQKTAELREQIRSMLKDEAGTKAAAV